MTDRHELYAKYAADVYRFALFLSGDATEAEERAELEAVRRFLQTFPEVDRAALLLRADGVAYAEIAAALGISLASAKVKVHRLRLRLAEWRIAREGTGYSR